MNQNLVSRKYFSRLTGMSLLGASMSGWLPLLASQTEQAGIRPLRSCILLWMSGGPSQIDTFDPKPNHENGGPTKAIETSVPGIQIAEYLPQLATRMQHLAPIRSMTTKEGDHARATFYLRTGYLPQGPVRYPSMGSFLGKELRHPECDLPSCVSIGPFRAFSPAAFGPGFLGPAWSPLVVSASAPEADEVTFEVQNLKQPSSLTELQASSRLQLLASMEHCFLHQRPGNPGASHLQSYAQAERMMKSGAAAAFELDQEPPALRDAYGRNSFGQGCLLARRLVEKGVSFIEVSLNGTDDQTVVGWDTHADNFTSIRSLCGILDPAWSTLMSDLQQRGLLEQTLVVWMGEFGRTPKINENTGRDHWPGGWSAVLGGGGILGGQVHGETSADGLEVAKNPLTAPCLMATICHALGLNHETTNISNIGRPIPLADHGSAPVSSLLKV